MGEKIRNNFAKRGKLGVRKAQAIVSDGRGCSWVFEEQADIVVRSRGWGLQKLCNKDIGEFG